MYEFGGENNKKINSGTDGKKGSDKWRYIIHHSVLKQQMQTVYIETWTCTITGSAYKLTTSRLDI